METTLTKEKVSKKLETFTYENTHVRNFAYASMMWGIVGMLAGLLIAFQLFLPDLNFDLPYTTFGRVRPIHTNAIIFAFVGNAIFMGVYYSLPRLCKTPMFSNLLGTLHFWLWQLIIVLAAVTLGMGITVSKEYAELEWPIDILITVAWVIFGINMLGTIYNRRESHIYVGIWFYLGTWITVAVLHIVNSLGLPVTLIKSYTLFSGVQDALIQWWYGHNAVAFFLTTPYLGLMYYFVPKAAERPVYSYRLSIIHFWALIFIYIWAGPHHLLYTALPDWAQSLGTVFSVMLIAPSWGGMINGLLTLRGSWDKVRENPILKFMVVALTGYGMATFEGPMLSLKNVNALSHYTDWTVAHVHVGALAWNGFLTFGIFYWLIPRLFQTKLYSEKLANTHFWIGTLGILFYAIPMYWAGFTQGLMWKEFTAEGTLQYPNFLETVIRIVPMYMMRAIGGTLYLTGALIMIYNIIKTVGSGSFMATEEDQAPAIHYHAEPHEFWHRALERKPFVLLVLSLVAILVGTVIELIPMIMVKSNTPAIASVTPYTPLELQGRDIYLREGCYVCHSQMIRPFRSETERYGEYSKAGEFIYDRPFQWGSKRTGPDLHRVGGKYPDSWHYNHMLDPTSMSDGSIMPRYPWLFSDKLDNTDLSAKISTLRTLGTPYPTNYEDGKALEDLNEQSEKITKNLQEAGIKEANKDQEIVALIAYLQRLGTDIKKEQK